MWWHWAPCDVIGYHGMSFDFMSTCCRNFAQCGMYGNSQDNYLHFIIITKSTKRFIYPELHISFPCRFFGWYFCCGVIGGKNKAEGHYVVSDGEIPRAEDHAPSPTDIPQHSTLAPYSARWPTVYYGPGRHNNWLLKCRHGAKTHSLKMLLYRQRILYWYRGLFLLR